MGHSYVGDGVDVDSVVFDLGCVAMELVLCCGIEIGSPFILESRDDVEVRLAYGDKSVQVVVPCCWIIFVISLLVLVRVADLFGNQHILRPLNRCLGARKTPH